MVNHRFEVFSPNENDKPKLELTLKTNAKTAAELLADKKAKNKKGEMREEPFESCIKRFGAISELKSSQINIGDRIR